MFTHALLSDASCMKKTVTVGSSPEHRSPWFDAECRQILKKEKKKKIKKIQDAKIQRPKRLLGVWEKTQSIQIASPKEEK